MKGNIVDSVLDFLKNEKELNLVELRKAINFAHRNGLINTFKLLMCEQAIKNYERTNREEV